MRVQSAFTYCLFSALMSLGTFSQASASDILTCPRGSIAEGAEVYLDGVGQCALAEPNKFPCLSEVVGCDAQGDLFVENRKSREVTLVPKEKVFVAVGANSNLSLPIGVTATLSTSCNANSWGMAGPEVGRSDRWTGKVVRKDGQGEPVLSYSNGSIASMSSNMYVITYCWAYWKDTTPRSYLKK